MQFENLTKGQFIRDFKDTLHQEQLIRVAKATPTEIFTALAGLIRKYYTDTWIERKYVLSDNQEKIAFYLVTQVLVMVFVTVMDFSNNVLLMVIKLNCQIVGLAQQGMFGKYVKTMISLM